MGGEIPIPEANEFLLTNKDADIILENSKDGAWSLWFFDTPELGECLSVEYTPFNSPFLVVQAQRAADATRNMADLLHDDPSWKRVERLR